MPITLTTGVSIKSRESAAEGSSTAKDEFSKDAYTSWVDGTGAAAVAGQWNDYRTLGGSADSLDVAGGVTNRIGLTKTFTVLRHLAVFAAADNAGPLSVGGGSNALAALAGAAIPVRPGGYFVLEAPDATGLAVTAATADIIQVAGTSGDSYEIFIAGEE